MDTLYNEDAIKLIIESVKVLIKNNKFTEAFELMNKHFALISNDLSRIILLIEADFNELKTKIDEGTITDENTKVEKAKLKGRLISTASERVYEEINIQHTIKKLNLSIYKSTSHDNLERILGTNNNLVKINWLELGREKSKSVCQIVRADGRKGTGFVLEGGYILTNYHVLPNIDQAKKCKIIFDYEEDFSGNMRKTSEFFLDPKDSKFSDLSKYDYAYIKIKDNTKNPLSQWGYLELDTFSEPQTGTPVSIIQHPLGQTKQIALTSNNIISIDGCKIFYQTDTEQGSSGSPVFNQDWKVIALHHAGKAEEDGGLIINSKTGERRGANEGILIREIAIDLGLIS